MAVVAQAVVVALVGVLGISLGSKLRSREAWIEFADGVRDLRIVPRRFARTVAVCLLLAEGSVLATILVPATTDLGVAGAAVLFTVFAVGLACAVRRGAATSCHCFGAGGDVVSARHVVRTATLAGISALGAFALIRGAVDSYVPRTGSDAIFALSLGAMCVAITVWMDHLVWLFAGAPERQDSATQV